MHGAALLYNILLAERAEQLELSRYDGSRDDFAIRLDEWRREIENSDLGSWDLDGPMGTDRRAGRAGQGSYA